MMAERGAHLTGTVYGKPSIFEIAANKTLAKTLEPVTRKIITFLASVNLEKYTWLHRWSDEIYLLLITILQNYYLNNYSASFSETFYGLKRIALNKGKFKGNLSKKQFTLSLISLVLIPYFQRKIEKWKIHDFDTSENKHKFFFIRTYNIIYIIKELCTFYQYLLYLSNKSKYPSFTLRLLSITLTYANNDNEIGLLELIKELGQGNINRNNGLEILRLVIVRSIEVSAFFIQFLNWWSQEHNYNFNLLALPVPPPPQIPQCANQYKSICPVCKKKPWIPTALAISGFIYCYQCILKKIRENKKCPITGYPAKEDDLIRLYIQYF